jgi:glycerol transport system substrate-binding protein
MIAFQVRKFVLFCCVVAVAFVVPTACKKALPPKEAAKKWIDTEFQPSTLTKEQQMKEMEWFIKAAEPYKGMEIKTVAESIATHDYESKVLTQAFYEITGIKVTHDIIQEGDLIEKLQTQWQSGKSIYDAFVNDSDLIGAHWRYPYAVCLQDFMEGEGKDVTLPTLDVKDFMGISFTTAPDGKFWQLPDEQFANLYWFRYDWFKRPDFRAKFKKIYGYDLGVPVNWSAYEDIAEFFTNTIKEIDGVKVYGHNDYGKKSPDLGWRFTDSWLVMAGAGDKGIPFGYPVDDWGVRVDKNYRPVGASVCRGGATNSPAAKYALRKYIEWLDKYAPPGARGLDFYTYLPYLAKGNVAQQIFWYAAFVPDMVKPGPTVNPDGTPKWRMAPSPHGPYWQPGMKQGYQDAGSWTLFKVTPLKRLKAAWLFAQFTECKTVSLKKAHVGLTPVRDSDVRHQSFTERAPKLGGLVEFWRSPARVAWTPTGPNIPDYPKMAQLFWQNIGEASSGAISSDKAMDNLARELDAVMERIQRSGVQGDRGPKLNPCVDEKVWLGRPGHVAPKAKLANEKPRGETVDYDKLIEGWRHGHVR